MNYELYFTAYIGLKLDLSNDLTILEKLKLNYNFYKKYSLNWGLKHQSTLSKVLISNAYSSYHLSVYSGKNCFYCCSKNVLSIYIEEMRLVLLHALFKCIYPINLIPLDNQQNSQV